MCEQIIYLLCLLCGSEKSRFKTNTRYGSRCSMCPPAFMQAAKRFLTLRIDSLFCSISRDSCWRTSLTQHLFMRRCRRYYFNVVVNFKNAIFLHFGSYLSSSVSFLCNIWQPSLKLSQVQCLEVWLRKLQKCQRYSTFPRGSIFYVTGCRVEKKMMMKNCKHDNMQLMIVDIADF